MSKFVLYTMPLCPYCFKAKQFLNKHQVPFKEKTILHPSHLTEMRKLTPSLRVPIIQVKDRVLTGFSESEYKEAFAPYINRV